jgi:hypothetical protein
MKIIINVFFFLVAGCNIAYGQSQFYLEQGLAHRQRKIDIITNRYEFTVASIHAYTSFGYCNAYKNGLGFQVSTTYLPTSFYQKNYVLVKTNGNESPGELAETLNGKGYAFYLSLAVGKRLHIAAKKREIATYLGLNLVPIQVARKIYENGTKSVMEVSYPTRDKFYLNNASVQNKSVFIRAELLYHLNNWSVYLHGNICYKFATHNRDKSNLPYIPLSTTYQFMENNVWQLQFGIGISRRINTKKV